MNTIIQGEDRALVVRLENEKKEAIDLSVYDEITFRIKKADNTTLSKTLTGAGVVIVGSQPQNGKISVQLSEVETASLKTGVAGIEVELQDGTDTKIVQIEKQLEVKKRIT